MDSPSPAPPGFDIAGAARDLDGYAAWLSPYVAAPGMEDAMRLLMRNRALANDVAAFIRSQPGHVGLEQPLDRQPAA
jgi:hypothetical protein